MSNRILFGSAVLVFATVAALVGLSIFNPLIPTVQAGDVSAINLQQATTDNNTGIVVSGEGKVNVKPNIAIATIGVDITTATLGDATTQANTKMNAVIEKLKSMGIDDKDIQTSNYNLYPITNQNQPKGPDSGNTTPTITGYHVTNQVRVTIRKTADLGKILDAAVNAGANNIYGVSFGVDDMSPYQAQARAAAYKDALDKANQLAKTANITLGPVLAITEGASMPTPLPAARAYGLGGATDVPVETGQMQVVIDVTVRYGIK